MRLRCSENRRTKALQSEESPNKSNTGSQQQSKLEFRNKVSQKKTFFSGYFVINVSVVCFLMEGWTSDRVASNYSCQLDRRDEDSLVRWWRVGLLKLELFTPLLSSRDPNVSELTMVQLAKCAWASHFNHTASNACEGCRLAATSWGASCAYTCSSRCWCEWLMAWLWGLWVA